MGIFNLLGGKGSGSSKEKGPACAEQELREVSPNEQVIYMQFCEHRRGGVPADGWLVATDKRMWFFVAGFKEQREFSYATPVSVSEGRLVINNGEDLIKMPLAAAQRFAEIIREKRDQLAVPVVSYSPPECPTSLADEIKKFVELRDNGVLTEEEFQAQKARLLNE